MRLLPWLAALACACTPHERDDDVLSAAPSADPMPDAPAVTATPLAEAVPACEPVVADAPSALFGERLLIRMPKNVEILEHNPTFAMAAASGGFVVTCNAVLQRASLMLFRNEADKSLARYGHEVVAMLEKGGYVGARDLQWADEHDARMRGTVQIPATEGLPATVLLVDLARRHELVVLTVFEAHLDDFARLEPTLHASADSLLVAPP